MDKEIYQKLKIMMKEYIELDFMDTMKYIVAEETIKKINKKSSKPKTKNLRCTTKLNYGDIKEFDHSQSD